MPVLQPSLNFGTEFVKLKSATVSVIFTLILSVWTFPSLGQKVPGNSSEFQLTAFIGYLSPVGAAISYR
jgi:hypothetical protein